VIDFTLPELGENITAGDVLRVLVKPGDTLAKDQPVLELETDKATIEVPSSVAGQIKDVKVKAGDKVSVGQAILSVDDSGAPAAQQPAKKGAAPAAAKQAEGSAASSDSAKSASASDNAKAAPSPGSAKPEDTRAKRSAEPAAADGPERTRDEPASEGRAAASHGGDKVVDISRGARATSEPAAPEPELPMAPAAPSARRMARELGINIDQVGGSGPHGRISIDDVKAQAKRLVAGGAGVNGTAFAGEPLPDFTRWGDVERQPMKAVRRKTAQHLSVAWSTIPHVTQHDLADITGLEELRKRYAPKAEAAGGNLTITAIAAKVVATALKVFPQFNVSLDLAADQLIYKKYVNIGIAVDTDRGLLVPVIRDVDTKNIVQISAELVQLSEKARARKISLDQMQGGCFSISNLGGIGGTSFTPIVNAPEVAILGISRARMEPVYDNAGGFAPRLMLPLSLSYDHRAIDGADGARFLRWIVEALEQPFLLAFQG
jgi:pyruvate dehydrogenase E2 component (dihydrolipoyllysine-residue acetyltransferase)